jgi:glycosyltransferase A (GT-A) superfamily protein (DUF2064 family)
MAAALAEPCGRAADGHRRCRAWTPRCCSAAAQALQGHDAVFVPALDGGYGLVGLKRPQPALFDGMAWSHPQVMADTRARAAAAGLRLAELPPLHDIDEPADLVHLPAAWRADEAC